ncbi:MAG: translocation/assembly module TamB domain-containing protein [Pseudanabaenaceae cyanobacterium SKYGB_i_bin29]|nr:translocation/assembly module TamB domain-containing protein [Pseudanabaenaceae cyanobacterium SKYG29]MDW8421520.1 translocation/assembly module TamB domain-containing protein [Pseudanabaenaceae cyanobacterium SKYGB_i_bin29]
MQALRRIAAGLTLTVTASVLGGIWYGRYYLNTHLTPQLQAYLTKVLQRPIELGQVSFVSTRSVHLARTVIPPTPTQPDFYVFDRIELHTDPWELQRSGKLKLRGKLLRPRVFLPQDDQGQIPALTQEPITVELPDWLDLETIDVVEGRLTIGISKTRQLVTLDRLGINSRWDNLNSVLARGVAEVKLGQWQPDFNPTAMAAIGNEKSQGRAMLDYEWNLRTGDSNLQVLQQDVNLAVTTSFIPDLPFTTIGGKVDGNALIFFRPDREPQVKAGLKVKQGAVMIPGVEQPLEEIAGEFSYDSATTKVKGLQARYKKVLLTAAGEITPDRGLDIDLRIPRLDLDQSPISSPVPMAGKVAITGKLRGTEPSFYGKATALEPLTIDRIPIETAELVVATSDWQTWQLPQLRFAAAKGVVQGSGKLVLGEQPSLDVNLLAQDIEGETIAQLYQVDLPFPLGNVQGSARLTGGGKEFQLVIDAQAPQAKYPFRAQATVAPGMTTVDRVELNLPEGKIRGEGLITDKGWSAKLSTPGLQLPQTTVAGTLEAISPNGSLALEDIRATAKLELPQGIGQFQATLTGNLAWDGKNILVQTLQLGEVLTATGEIELEKNDRHLPQGIGEINLQVRSENAQLEDLRFLFPQIPAKLVGNLDFRGQVRGELERLQILGDLKGRGITLAGENNLPEGTIEFSSNISGSIFAPQIQGRATLVGLGYQGISFDPVLAGDFRFDQGGIKVDLRGNRDRINLDLNTQLQPQSIDLRLGDAKATARSLASDQLQVEVENFPLGLVATALGQTEISGIVAGRGEINLGKNFQTVGQFTIDRPAYGRVQGETLRGDFTYTDGNFLLQNGELTIPVTPDRTSAYQLEVAYNPRATTRLQASLTIAEGNLQDITQIMQWSQWSDIAQGLARPRYASGKDLATFPPVGLSQAPFSQQLQYFFQIQQRLTQQEIATAKRSVLPPLTDLAGSLSGKITVTDSAPGGLGVQVNLVGKDWEYGKFAVNDISLQGEYRNGTLKIARARLQSDQSFGELQGAQISLIDPQTGKLGEIQGELELENFPIESLRPLPFLQLIPVEVTGKLKGKAKLGGNILQPQVEGELELVGGTISQEPIESITGAFTYKQGRLSFNSTLALAGAPPMQLRGNLPLAIGYVFPGTQLEMNLEVKDQALAFVNLLTPNLRWLDGKGEAKIAISGTTKQPKLLGNATVTGARIQVAGLPEEITDLQGKVEFDLDRATVDLQGRFSQGELLAQGSLPISNETLVAENPLTLTATKLTLNLKNTYSGNFDGQVTVGGSLQNPVLTGKVTLSNGRILLPEETIERNGSAPAPISFRNLKVALADNVQITRAPLFNFVGRGEVEVNGSIKDIRPAGRIAITRGQVNAISARFRLDRSFDNFAEFLPTQGLDPNLNVRVLGVVPEVIRPPIEPSPFDAFNPSAIPVSNLGAQRTLQVQATVTGRGSSPTIELRSSPPRTNSEILALIGGGLLTQTGGDPTATLVNLAGGTIVSLLQDAIGDVLSLSEFNLSPVTTGGDGKRISALGLAAEGAIEIGRDFSLSIRGVINDPSQNTNYTLRYRLDPNTLIRTNTDLGGNNSLTIEWENRF